MGSDQLVPAECKEFDRTFGIFWAKEEWMRKRVWACKTWEEPFTDWARSTQNMELNIKKQLEIICQGRRNCVQQSFFSLFLLICPGFLLVVLHECILVSHFSSSGLFSH